MKQKIRELDKERLQEVILQMLEFLSEEQKRRLEELIDRSAEGKGKSEGGFAVRRMSPALVNEKMEQMKIWMEQIDEGEFCLETYGYEDYSGGYWDSDWVTEYTDSQGIGDKIMSMIQFAKDCVNDMYYPEAVSVYNWLWDMCVSTDGEYDDTPVDFETLAEEKIISVNMEQIALLTLYADYQSQEADRRAADMYLYFCHGTFRELHIEDMFHVGRENLDGKEQFWKDWIELLSTQSGNAESRLLQEAVLYAEGVPGLVKRADENCRIHPALYLAAMKEHEKDHDYAEVERVGERALERIDVRLTIRGRVALMTAYASTVLMHQEKEMLFCWEAYRSDTTVRNFLRLFGRKEMAERYGMRGEEALAAGIRESAVKYGKSQELEENIPGDDNYYLLKFYNGDFRATKEASKNPRGSLGWSTCFIRYGIRLFLLYLYDNPLPSRAMAAIAQGIGFPDDEESAYLLPFEKEIAEESRRLKISVFWNYFQRWKQYFQMEPKEKSAYLQWAEKIVYSRADAIVSGQHRGSYASAAVLLAAVAEVKESVGEEGIRAEIFAEYKKKFPRHSSFQAEMRTYFNR